MIFTELLPYRHTGKLLSFLLAAIMTIQLMPITMIAAELDGNTQPAIIFTADKTGYHPGETVMVTVSCDIPSDMTLKELNVTVDLPDTLNVSSFTFDSALEAQRESGAILFFESLKGNNIVVSDVTLESSAVIGVLSCKIDPSAETGACTLSPGYSQACDADGNGYYYDPWSSEEPTLSVSSANINVAFGNGEAFTIPTLYAGALNLNGTGESIYPGGWKRSWTYDMCDWNTGMTYAYQSAENPVPISLALKGAAFTENYDHTEIKWYKSETKNYTEADMVGSPIITTAPNDYSQTDELTKELNLSKTFAEEEGECYITAVVTNYFNGEDSIPSLSAESTIRLTTLAENADLYDVSNGEVTAYYGAEPTMTIPEEDSSGGPVTAINRLSDEYSDAVIGTQKVVIPEGITDINGSAFRNFATTQSFTIPASVTDVGDYAFYGAGSQGGTLTLSFNSKDGEKPSVGDSIVNLTNTNLIVRCYEESAAHEWALTQQVNYPDDVTIRLISDNNALRVIIKDRMDQTLGAQSFSSVQWLREDSDEVLLSGSTDYTLAEDSVIDSEHRYICRVEFAPDTRNTYLVPETLDFVFEEIGNKNLVLKERDTITYRGTITESQRASVNSLRYTMTQAGEDGETVSNTEEITIQSDGSFTFTASVLPTVLKASGWGMSLTLRDIQTRIPGEDGVIDLGELSMNSIIFNRVYRGQVTADEGSALRMAVQEGADGFYLVNDRTGEEFRDISFSVADNGRYYLYLGNSAGEVFMEGDTATICYEPSNEWSRYIFKENGKVTLRQSYYEYPLNVDKSPVFEYKGCFVRTEYIDRLAAIGAKFFLFNAEGKKMSIDNTMTYLDEGEYTLIALSEYCRINTISSVEDLELLGLPEWSYTKKVFTVENGKRYTFRDFVPYVKLDNIMSVSLEADSTGVINGLVPVYLKYKIHDDTITQTDQIIFYIMYDGNRVNSAVFPLVEINGTHAFMKGTGNISTEKVLKSVGAYTFEALKLTLSDFDSEGVICLYARPERGLLFVKAEDTSVGASVVLPSCSISVTEPSNVTNSGDGNISMRIMYDEPLYANLYLDGKKTVERQRADISGYTTTIAYNLPYYSDGASVHDIYVDVENEEGNVVWTSDTWQIIRTDEPMPEPQTMTIRQTMPGTNTKTFNADFQKGRFPELKLTTYPRTFKSDNSFNVPLTYDYKLTMSQPNMVKDKCVTMTVWCGKDRDEPLKQTVKLNYNSQTGTFDGTLEFAAGTIGVGDLPYGFDLDYSYDMNNIPASKKQTADKWALRKAERSFNEEDSLIPAERVDMDRLNFMLESDVLVHTSGRKLTDEEKSMILQNAQLNNDFFDINEEITETMTTALADAFELEEEQLQDPLALLDALGMSAEEDVTLTESELTARGFESIEIDGQEAWYISEGGKLEQIYDPEAKLLITLGTGGMYSGPQARSLMSRSARSSDEGLKEAGTDGLDSLYEANYYIQIVTRYLTAGLDGLISGIDLLIAELKTAEAAGLASYVLDYAEFADDTVYLTEADAKAITSALKSANLTSSDLSVFQTQLKSLRRQIATLNIDKSLIGSVRNSPVAKRISVMSAFLSIFSDFFSILDNYDYCQSKIKSLQGEVELAERYFLTTKDWAYDLQTDSSDEFYYKNQVLTECKKTVSELWEQADDAIDWCGYFAKSKVGTGGAGIVMSILSLIPALSVNPYVAAVDVSVWTVGNVNELVCRIGIETNQKNVDDLWDDVIANCKKPPEFNPSGNTGGNQNLGRPDDEQNYTPVSPDEPYTPVIPGDIPYSPTTGYQFGDQIPGYSNPDDLFPPNWPQNPNDGPPENPETPETPESPEKKPTYETPPKPEIDPAGYVYEAVASNRVEGAKATIYYKTGSDSEAEWDAEEYDQINPQITGEDGAYSWMTPPGSWRVKATKNGYLPADSKNDPAADRNGWLPVPPPQVNVNIALVSAAAPTVVSAEAAENEIQVVFSQYMDIAQIEDGGFVSVTQNGESIPVTISFNDAEESPTSVGTYYGRVMQICREDGEAFDDGVEVKITAGAKNYADNALASDYTSGALSVIQIVGSIEHSYPNRFVTDVGTTGTLAVQVLDTMGNPMSGVTVTAEQEYGGTLELSATAVSDRNGRAQFTVKGISSGYDVIHFTAGTVSAEMNTRVAPIGTTAPAKPTANLRDYDSVNSGTQLILTAQPGATIYYTTDNTCPCDEGEGRMVYTGPITLTQSDFYRIAAYTAEGGYSERLNLHLTVTTGTTDTPSDISSSGGGGGYASPKHEIGVENTEYGTVTVSPKNASAGKTVTVTVKPDEGYALDKLTVTDANGKEITLTPQGAGKYTFSMPDSEVNIKADFADKKSVTNPFVDLEPGAYYYDAALWAAENGVTSGTSATTFSPNAACTRAEIVTFLWRAVGCPAPKSREHSFTDVEPGTYYYEAMLWAVENGITAGTSDTTFSPDATCTRGEAVTFLWRTVGKPDVNGENPFVDVKNGTWYTDAVLWAVEEAVTGGTGNDTFSPDATCTRGQIVTFLYRCMK